MASSWELLEESVLLWKGILNKNQRAALPPFIKCLPVVYSRALLTGAGRSFARATWSLWETYNLQLHDQDGIRREKSSCSTGRTADHLDESLRATLDLPADSQDHAPLASWDPDVLLRLREEGDFGEDATFDLYARLDRYLDR